MSRRSGSWRIGGLDFLLPQALRTRFLWQLVELEPDRREDDAQRLKYVDPGPRSGSIGTSAWVESGPGLP
jgi:hypothetical protein